MQIIRKFSCNGVELVWNKNEGGIYNVGVHVGDGVVIAPYAQMFQVNDDRLGWAVAFSGDNCVEYVDFFEQAMVMAEGKVKGAVG